MKRIAVVLVVLLSILVPRNFWRVPMPRRYPHPIIRAVWRV